MKDSMVSKWAIQIVRTIQTDYGPEASVSFTGPKYEVKDIHCAHYQGHLEAQLEAEMMRNSGLNATAIKVSWQ